MLKVSPDERRILLTPTEAAAVLGITERKLKDLGRRGVIPMYDWGHRTLRFDVREFVERNEIPAGGPTGPEVT